MSSHAALVATYSPTLFLRLGESTGTTATDSSGNGLNGTYAGSFTLGQTDPLIGDGDTAALIAQSTGKVTVPHNTGLNLSTQSTDRWSIEWLMATASNPTDSFPTVFTKGSATSTATGSKGWLLFLSGGNLFWKAGNAQISIGALAFSTSFQHVILVWDGAHLKLYVNGSLVAGTAVPTAVTTDNTSSFVVNQTSANVHPGNSTYDEVAVYPSALASTDVTALYGSLGNTGGTNVSLADTGTGVDAAAVSAAVPAADTGSGADAVNVSIIKTVADTGSGSDAAVVTTVAARVADTGTGADALSLTTIAVPVADSGSATDAATVHATIPLADTGTGVDTVRSSGFLADTGAGTDALAITARTIFLADAGAAADTVVGGGTVSGWAGPVTPTTFADLADAGTAADTLATGIPVTDDATGADDVTVAAGVPVADTGSGANAVTVTVAVPLADSGAGVDAVTVALLVPIADTGVGSDTATVHATIPATDTGTGTDTTAITAITARVSDTAAAADAATVGALIPVTDTGSGTDAVTLIIQPQLPDTATAADALTVHAVIPLLETGRLDDAAGAPPSHVPGTSSITFDGLSTATLATNGLSTAVLTPIRITATVEE